MAIEKYIIDKSDLTALLSGEDLAIQPKGNIKGFCVEIAGDLTNGDVIKALFPNMCKKGTYCEFFFDNEKAVQTNSYMNVSKHWLNAPYKAD